MDRKLYALTVVSFALLALAVVGVVVASQYSCPPQSPVYSQPGLRLAYRLEYSTGNATYTIIKYMNVTSRENGLYNASYLILDVSGYLSGTPGSSRQANATYRYGENLALEEFPLKGSFIPIGAKVFRIQGSPVLAMGYYDPSRNLIVYVDMEYGIPVYATMSGGGENVTYTLMWLRGVSGCGAWQG